jgi:hypothetical protein
MPTWIFKGPVSALALTSLAACGEGQGPSFLKGLSAPSVALSQADMAFGAVTLKAPSGFCIDKSSLKQHFALMARCDAFGVPSAAGTAPVGLITVSFSAITDVPSLPSPQDTAKAMDLQQVSDPIEVETGVIFRATGTVPVEGMSARHWRATAQIGTQLMGLALFAPEDSAAAQDEGRSILSAVIAEASAGS